MRPSCASSLRRVLVGALVASGLACTTGGGNGVPPSGSAGSSATGGSAGAAIDASSDEASEASSGAAGVGGAGHSGGEPDAGPTPSFDGEAPDVAPDTSSDGKADASSDAAVAMDAGPIRHHLMAMEYPGRIVELSADGKVAWEHTTPGLALMFDALSNGHVFFPYGGASRGAQEVDRNHAVVWSYTSKAAELLGGERLANGNSLLGEGGPAIALELDPAKAVVRSIAIPTTETEAHRQVRHLHRLANGNILVALEGEGAARELDANGKMVWEYKGVTHIHEALRLPNGNTLIGGGESKKVLEVTSGGQIAWQFGEQDAPTLGLAWICSVQVLKNGNLLVTNWLGANGGTGVHAFEVTRDKKVVWTLDDHKLLKSVTTVRALDD
jgi:hypothetical protein